MGLDMRPMGRPKSGFEKRFVEIFKILENGGPAVPSFWEKLKGRKQTSRDDLLAEWFEIQEPSYEVIKAPRVGRDKEADEWIVAKITETRGAQPSADILKEFDGFYVIELAKELDGVPVYISGAQDENVFRGQFMNLCVELIGEELVNEAWNSKLAPDALNYGYLLMEAADKVACEHKLQYLKDQREVPDTDENSIELKLHVVFSLARWLIFYGKNGHGYEADF